MPAVESENGALADLLRAEISGNLLHVVITWRQIDGDTDSRIQAACAAARCHLRRSEPESAHTAAQTAHDLAEQAYGLWHATTLQTLHLRAQTASAADRHTGAAADAEHLYLIAKALHGADDSRTANAARFLETRKTAHRTSKDHWKS